MFVDRIVENVKYIVYFSSTIITMKTDFSNYYEHTHTRGVKILALFTG